MAANTNTCVISGSSVANVEETTRVHLMPCQIEHDGKANIHVYFDPTVREEEPQNAALENDTETKPLSASFRGRGLKGVTVQLPAGYSGYAIKEEKRAITDEEDRVLKVTHKFTQFKHWNLETLPSSNDAIFKALQWVDIAAVLHGQDEENEHATPETIR